MVGAAIPAKAEMLAAAKRKLKDFEARQKIEERSSPASSIISSEPGAGAGLNGRSSVVSEDFVTPQGTNTNFPAQSLSARNGINISPFQHNGNEWYQAYIQLKTQHDELCAHYAQLHSAYSQVNANGVHVDAENQIIQLQNALSAMVEEKVSFQSDLRHANEQIEQFRHKIIAAEDCIAQMSKEVPSSSFLPNSEEIRTLTDLIAQKDSLLTARYQELDGARREMASIQANLLNVQHERSEAQARVKSLIKETTAQEGRIEQLKKDIQMKDLHLRQLGGSVPIGEKAHDNNAYENLQRELENVKSEKSRLLAEAATLKSHYSEREHALQRKQVEMALELEQLHNQQVITNDHVQNLEHQLQIAQSELQTLQSMKDIPDYKDEAQIITEEDVIRRIREACHAEKGKWERRIEEDQKIREEEILQKDKVIFEREQSLAELEMKYRLLEERTLQSTSSGSDLLSLSEQLQNEKTTVSRAVAQNKELKERLLETEDRFVALTEEKAAVELAKQSAEHQVRELTKQLNLEAAGLVGNISEVIASQPHLEATPPSQMGTHEVSQHFESQEMAKLNDELKEALETVQRENSEIKSVLELKTRELQLVRADLRRSNTQNEQMDGIMRQNAEDENQNSIHVELSQAVGRVQELATENEQLREALSDIRQQLEDERSDKRADTERRELECGQQQLELTEVNAEKEVEQLHIRELHEDLWARKELEKRFARAMMQNAELLETIDRLEHINQQLELENDTIADHVVLYQHQRKLIRERLRVKDEQLKAMEEERVRTVSKCRELNDVLMHVLNDPNSRSRKAAPPVSRSYSHSTVDEMSGDEDVVIDAKMQAVPEREKVHGLRDDEKVKMVPTTVLEAEGKDSQSPDFSTSNEESPGNNHDAWVRRVLDIMSDINRPQQLPSVQLHCTQCIGDIQEL